MKKLNFLKPLKLLIIYIFGYKNVHNLQVCLVRFLKKIPLYYYFPEETKISKNIIIGKKNSEVFFGYYDITPFDYSGNKILCHIYDQKKNAKEIYLGYVNINSRKEPKIKIFSKTEVWCWQMGSRLQWFPSSSNNLVIFNTIIKDNYGAVVKNTENSEIIYSFDKPIYSLANSGKSALYLNFNRLHRLRPGYGYRNFKDNTNRELAPENDGLFKLDLETGKSSLLYSLKEISSIEPLNDYGKAEHYLNHILWSPDCDKYIFFHLWQKKNIKRSRLMLAGSNISLSCLYSQNEGNISHYVWKNNNEILITTSDQSKIIRYFLINVEKNTSKIVGEKNLKEDGHPSFSPNNNKIILNDTYPDKYRNQHLYFYDTQNEVKKKIAYFYSPTKFSGEFRCDLHPRFSHDGSKICIDSPHAGKRQMIIISPNA